MKTLKTRKAEYRHPAAYYARARKLRRDIFDSQGGKCKECGRVLDYRKANSHHIDGDIKNNEMNNIILLCASCHRKTHWDRGDQPRRRAHSKWLDIKGFNGHDLKGVGIDPAYVSRVYKWENIKDRQGAKYWRNGYGTIVRDRWVCETGYSLQRMADYMNITRERVRQLLNKHSPRIDKTVEEMKTAGIIYGIDIPLDKEAKIL